MVRNAIGYNEDGVYYHYIKNHLGSNCAVVRSENDETVQSTIYYPSGVPMRISSDRDKQPYLYGDKEFVEAHGLNEYDSQARMYYATIMRTTTMDPHAENNYHLSPYSWCDNNPVNRIDPNGMDVYNCQGKNISRFEDPYQDVIRMNDNQIAFEYGSITSANSDEHQAKFTFGDSKVAAEAFKFISCNSEFEFALFAAEEEESKIITKYDPEKVDNICINEFSSMPSLYAFVHNHPNNSEPSGFKGPEPKGDRKAAQILESSLKIDVAMYVYLPKFNHLVPFDAYSIYARTNWESVFTPSGKIIGSPQYLFSQTKYLAISGGPTYPTIQMH